MAVKNALSEQPRGTCPVCRGTFQVTRAGVMRHHNGDVVVRGGWRQVCEGVGVKPAMLGTYLSLTADTDPDVARTVEVSETLMIDLDPDGYVLGVESLTGAIGIPELIRVLQTLRHI